MKGAIAAIGIAAAVSMTAQDSPAETRYTVLDFADLRGWERDDHDEAIPVFLETCRDIDLPDWAALCALATTEPNAQTFFELFFRPVLIEDGDPALFTGYFEPELTGSRTRSDRFRYPLYAMPPDVTPGQRWHSRGQIERLGLLEDRGLEIAWVDDPVDAFFLQIQGSGRVQLAEGGGLRVGFAGKNGHDYRSIGEELVRRGVFEPHQVSAQVIRNWVKDNPEAGRRLLWHNPSYVFFREVSDVPAERGPLGAMNRSITAHRTLAVDPAYVPLGAPVWVEKGGDNAFQRLMIAQDTGSAIKGAQRGDIFFGTGAQAGRAAGRIRDPGRMVVLLPIQRAYALAPGGRG